MRPNEIIHEIEKLDLSEKLLLVENIWDSIAKTSDTLPMPKWHKTELDKRYRDYQDGKLKLRDWQSVHSKLRKQSK